MPSELNVLVVALALTGAVACSDEAVAPGGAAGQSSVGAAGANAAGSEVGGSGAGPQGGSGGGAAVAGTGGVAVAGAGVGGSAVGGSSGNSGAAGAAGGGAGGSGGAGRPSGPSAGCLGPAATDEPQKAIQHDLMVDAIADKYKPTYVTRKYYTTLPKDFDPTKPYPIIFYGQGCGQVNSESGPFSGGHFASDALYVQLIPAVVNGQTVVPPNGAPGCFQAGKQGLADSPDGPYFDRVLAELESNYCVDRGRVYVAGWSSGAWLANYLACARGNVITGTAAGSGGLQHDHGECTGGAAVMILPGDAGAITEAGHEIGAQQARDTLVMANGGGTPMAVKYGNADCQVYPGNGPVAWCPTGTGHGDPLGPIADAAWAFWTSLPQ